jgi:hypothetical protein
MRFAMNYCDMKMIPIKSVAIAGSLSTSEKLKEMISKSASTFSKIKKLPLLDS